MRPKSKSALTDIFLDVPGGKYLCLQYDPGHQRDVNGTVTSPLRAIRAQITFCTLAYQSNHAL